MKSNYWLVLLSALMLAIGQVGCSPAAPATVMPDDQALKEKADQEATAIIRRAEATAVVLRAQATAAALIQSASGPTSTPTPFVPTPTRVAAPSIVLASPVPTAPAPVSASSPLASPAGTLTTTEHSGTSEVELLRVTFGADGAYIVVQFLAQPRVAETFWPGVLSVVDEATGAVYNEVPVMPVIGPLIARPKEAGQLGYVMLVNAPPGLRPGSSVTVILADFRQEHVTVQ